MPTLAILILVLVASPMSAYAQSNPKREKCLSEAEQQGLFSSVRGKGTERSNAAMAPQRAAFMKECMGRR
ncbi:hypothetical protein [Methylobacterium sp. J-076]|uniref:hypothetical protein n=1 Tax=Methylobacterium sp. J-076 TaxID=2836655 RepID=UPI001FBA751B|nr:hypothetical protein [Methylobacterium sp. J-076]MCJ2013593.1 hypothetical protein [Methylobacterium sp. J-076]